MNLIAYITVVYLTNRFQVAVRLFSNRELKMRRRNETTTTTGSWICTDARAAHVSVCVFVVHGSSTTKFARESGSTENVSNTFFLEALFRRFQLIFRCGVPGRVLYVQ